VKHLLLLTLLALPIATSAEETATSDRGLLRLLDKTTGRTTDLEMQAGETETIGQISVQFSECRYPVNNPSGNAYALVVVRDARVEDPVFEGWLIASAPALNAMDHPRYDVWVLRCITS
jgi:hypothetical protein